ncbi:hypothetical protein BDR05DRAFT_990078 [Suillus weaverae]|nr:hypothetical protein BDR05DRAFT_993413 [Suillus weaverae]KAG2342784.1 hypothetical protein BDR05DRAFT_990078 [Suillus weaverae]
MRHHGDRSFWGRSATTVKILGIRRRHLQRGDQDGTNYSVKQVNASDCSGRTISAIRITALPMQLDIDLEAIMNVDPLHDTLAAHPPGYRDVAYVRRPRLDVQGEEGTPASHVVDNPGPAEVCGKLLSRLLKAFEFFVAIIASTVKLGNSESVLNSRVTLMLTPKNADSIIISTKPFLYFEEALPIFTIRISA